MKLTKEIAEEIKSRLDEFYRQLVKEVATRPTLTYSIQVSYNSRVFGYIGSKGTIVTLESSKLLTWACQEAARYHSQETEMSGPPGRYTLSVVTIHPCNLHEDVEPI